MPLKAWPVGRLGGLANGPPWLDGQLVDLLREPVGALIGTASGWTSWGSKQACIVLLSRRKGPEISDGYPDCQQKPDGSCRLLEVPSKHGISHFKKTGSGWYQDIPIFWDTRSHL